MNTYLVTGTSGFVGGNVLLELLGLGHRVVACDYAEPVAALRDEAGELGDVEWVSMDVSDEAAWDALPGYDYEAAIHTAAITAPEDDPDPKRTAAVNLMGTLYALDWAVKRDVPRLVYTSSSAVYRYTTPSGPMKESMCVDPRFTYGLTKIAGERFLSIYRDNLGLDCCAVRLPSMYGPWERPTGTRKNMSQVYHLARAVAAGETCKVAGAEVAQDWTYIGDAARGLIHLASVRGGPDVMNLSTGEFITLAEVIDAFNALEPDNGIEWVPESEADVVMTGTSGNQPMDPTLLEETGFVAKTSIEEGLRSYLEWLRR